MRSKAETAATGPAERRRARKQLSKLDFSRIAAEHPYRRTNVFFCGPYPLGRTVRIAARRAGFHFRMEQF